MKHPVLCALADATMMDIGVAGPAHGQAMMSTATAVMSA